MGRGGKSGGTKGFREPVVAAPLFLRGTKSQAWSGRDDVQSPGTYREGLEWMMARRDPEAWLVFIPHWLFLLAVALPWAALLAWRARRRRTGSAFS